jgi:hypothetical protein
VDGLLNLTRPHPALAAHVGKKLCDFFRGAVSVKLAGGAEQPTVEPVAATWWRGDKLAQERRQWARGRIGTHSAPFPLLLRRSIQSRTACSLNWIFFWPVRT